MLLNYRYNILTKSKISKININKHLLTYNQHREAEKSFGEQFVTTYILDIDLNMKHKN